MKFNYDREYYSRQISTKICNEAGSTEIAVPGNWHGTVKIFFQLFIALISAIIYIGDSINENGAK